MSDFKLKELWGSDQLNNAGEHGGRPIKRVVERAIRNVKVSPFTAVVALVLSSSVIMLLGLFLLLAQNMNSWFQRTEENLKMIAFLKEGTALEAIDSLRNKLHDDRRFSKVLVIGKDEALQQFSKRLSQGKDLLVGLEMDNPLLDSIEVTLRNQAVGKDISSIKRIAEDLGSLPEVDTVDYDSGLLGQFLTTAEKIKSFGGWIMLGLLIVAAVLVATCFRLSLYAHRDEIAIMRLVGSTDADIRLPYLIEGAVLGGMAGILALFMTRLVAWLISTQILTDQLLQLVFSGVDQLTLWRAVSLPCLGSILGLLGSFLAVRRFIEMAESEELE
jgi:cell division transport system permease protein